MACAAHQDAPGGLPTGSTSVGTRVQLDHLARVVVHRQRFPARLA